MGGTVPSHVPQGKGNGHQDQPPGDAHGETRAAEDQPEHGQRSAGQDEQDQRHRRQQPGGALTGTIARRQGGELTLKVFAVLPHPLVFDQPPPGGAEGVVTFRQPGGIQGRRFRGQLFPGFLGLQLAVEQRAPLLFQAKLHLPEMFAASGQPLFPARHPVAYHQGCVERPPGPLPPTGAPGRPQPGRRWLPFPAVRPAAPGGRGPSHRSCHVPCGSPRRDPPLPGAPHRECRWPPSPSWSAAVPTPRPGRPWSAPPAPGGLPAWGWLHRGTARGGEVPSAGIHSRSVPPSHPIPR